MYIRDKELKISNCIFNYFFKYNKYNDNIKNYMKKIEINILNILCNYKSEEINLILSSNMKHDEMIKTLMDL